MNQSQPWFTQYDPGVQSHLEYPDVVIQDYLINQSAVLSERIALICEERTITYSQLHTLSRNFACNLMKSGLKKGDIVGICLPNTIEFVITYFGILMAGGVVAAMNPSAPLPEWAFQSKIVNSRILIGPTSRLFDLLELQKIINCSHLILVERDNDERQDRAIYQNAEIIHFNKMIVSTVDPQILPKINPSNPAMVQFSGGTTGVPKAALALHRNIAANILQFSKWLTTLEKGKEVFLTMIPLYHVYGMVIGLNVGIALGATIVLIPVAKDLNNVLGLIEKHKVTFFPGVPSIYNAVNHNPKVLSGEVNLSTIKACISGSAPLLRSTREQFERLTGGKLVEGYGLSEAPTATHCNPIQGENREGSIGLPLPDVDCKIVDVDDENKVMQIGEQGELLIKSPQIMKEYLESPDETSRTLSNGWLHTGDIVRMDVDGYFYIVGRNKDLIKVNGLQVWPVEVESILAKYPGVREVAVAGVPDQDTGEAVKAWIVTERPSEFDQKKLKLFLKRYLTAYKVPKEIEIVQELPKTSVGKILRRELVRMEMEKQRKTGA